MSKATREELIRQRNELRGSAWDTEKILSRRHGLVPCPHNCFEQEPGNGSFEKVTKCGWGVEACSVCGGLGMVTREAATEYQRRFGVWFKQLKKVKV